MTRTPRITLRSAVPADAKPLHALIARHLVEGRLLPRAEGELRLNARRFVVAVRGRAIVGCAELAPLSPHVAEVRSLVVDQSTRRQHVGLRLVHEIQRRARREGFEKLCAFVHAPGYFAKLGFSVQPHLAFPEKIATDCVNCAQFGHCGQYAMVMPVDHAAETAVPDPGLQLAARA